MEQERIKEIANKYRKTQKKVTITITALIIVLGLVVISLGIFFIISTEVARIIVGSIMIIAGILDITLGIRLIKAAKIRVSKLSDLEAYKRYVKITGKK